MKRRALILSAAGIGLSLLVAPVAAQTIGTPIPGIDIIVKKNPGGVAVVVGQSGRDGRFSGSVRVESGSYQIEAACPARQTCRAYRLTEVLISGRALAPNAKGEFIFPVGTSTREVQVEVTTFSWGMTRPR